MNVNVEHQFKLNGYTYRYNKLTQVSENGDKNIKRLPFSIRILLESLIRNYDGYEIKKSHIESLWCWGEEKRSTRKSIPYKPTRVILQDLTGVPAIVDLASLRETMENLKQDPNIINPEVPVDLVIDHSVQVDEYGNENAFMRNMQLEFLRNKERYTFLRWSQQAFDNFKIIPPGAGIVHQVNLEYLATVIHTKKVDDQTFLAYPDTLVGTDSHTPMINGLGIVGWGVGGIEAEASMLGQASYVPIPEVVGVELKGKFPEGTTATDLALAITQLLRKKNVVGKFVEFFGEGLEQLPLADRATIANMAPEYGATMAYFPIDEQTLDYLTLTGRDEAQIKLIKTYCQKNNLWYDAKDDMPEYSDLLTFNLSQLEPNIAGPKRPQDLIPLSKVQRSFKKSITAPLSHYGYGLNEKVLDQSVTIIHENGQKSILNTGSIVIAAITSCTNTSNPHVMISAGLLAKKAVEKGLEVPAYVKTSLAPGSKVVMRYLDAAGLTPYLEKLGFHLTGYGCTTCMGNSGALLPEVEDAIKREELIVTSVLSGNRNFEGRVHPLTRANYLSSPPLVIAFAIAGTINIHLGEDSLGKDEQGNPIYLRDIWPTIDEVSSVINRVVKPSIFKEEYDNIYESNEMWNDVEIKTGPTFAWDKESTYIQNPPFTRQIAKRNKKIQTLQNLRTLVMLGDTTTTDHISPAGAIPIESPAGKYLQSKDISPRQFNSYGSRRGNHHVMIRGTFANIRLRNQLVPNCEGGYTKYWPTEEVMTIYEAAQKYKQNKVGLVVIAGKDYGMGSSRDWAAKGTSLLGVKAVIAESFERIHRSNLVMMGVLPLEFRNHENSETLGLDGSEVFNIQLYDNLKPGDLVTIKAKKKAKEITFQVVVKLNDEIDIDYYRQGGILPKIIQEKCKKTE